MEKLTPEEIDAIKRKGSVVIRGVVDTKTASGWKTELEEFIKANPQIDGRYIYLRQSMRSMTFFFRSSDRLSRTRQAVFPPLVSPTCAAQYYISYQTVFSWTRPQVQARAHPNVLKTSTWLNNLYHVKSGNILEGVDLSVPLTYADRFRIRHPGGHWGSFPPHVDSMSPLHIHDQTLSRL